MTFRCPKTTRIRSDFFRALAAASIAPGLLLLGCGDRNPTTSEQPAPTAVVDPSTTGSITGTVTLDGNPPSNPPVIMTNAPECAKLHSSPLTYPQVVAGNSGALSDVIVYVKSGLGNYRFDLPAVPVTLDQAGCMYEPHVLGIMVGQKLEVKNTDPVEHNVHPVPHSNRAWNKSQPIGSGIIETSFEHPELAVRVLCNLHPWMRAYVFVFSHPYFDVTSTAGTFDLKNLPPGTYTIEAWQEKYGTQDQTVTLGPKETKSVSFTFAANKS